MTHERQGRATRWGLPKAGKTCTEGRPAREASTGTRDQRRGGPEACEEAGTSERRMEQCLLRLLLWEGRQDVTCGGGGGAAAAAGDAAEGAAYQGCLGPAMRRNGWGHPRARPLACRAGPGGQAPNAKRRLAVVRWAAVGRQARPRASIAAHRKRLQLKNICASADTSPLRKSRANELLIDRKMASAVQRQQRQHVHGAPVVGS